MDLVIKVHLRRPEPSLEPYHRFGGLTTLMVYTSIDEQQTPLSNRKYHPFGGISRVLGGRWLDLPALAGNNVVRSKSLVRY